MILPAIGSKGQAFFSVVSSAWPALHDLDSCDSIGLVISLCCVLHSFLPFVELLFKT